MKNINPFMGQTIAVTGKLEHFTRNQIYDRIRGLGGTPRSSVSRNTDYLICGIRTGSKLSKAKSFGTKIITEREFLDMTA
ncbi:MAG: hypothetical protein HFH34_02310 [Eubacterium sp.]|nr:hypothetical protein [Eubacterium sp.]